MRDGAKERVREDLRDGDGLGQVRGGVCAFEGVAGVGEMRG